MSEEQRLATLQAIHDEAVDAILTIDRRGVVLSCNPATETLFGYRPDEVLGQNVSMLMPSPDREGHNQYLENYHRSGQARIIGIGREVLARRKDGSTFPIHLAVSEIRVGEETRYAGVIRDLSEFKQLEQQETALGRIIEDSLNEVFIFAADTLKFMLVNRGGRQNLGYRLEELLQMTPADIQADLDESALHQLLKPLQAGNQHRIQLETRHRRKDGTDYDVEIHLQLSRYRNRAAYVGIALDVTQRREAEALLRQQREAMQKELEQLVEQRTEELQRAQVELLRNEKFSTLGKVAGGIAHEIRNPLNGVKTSAYFLLNARDPGAAKIREHLERIDRQVNLIENVITALTDVAKMPAALRVPVDVDGLVNRVIRGFDWSEEVAVDVQWDMPASLPPVLADEAQLVIAFKNLIRNAREAMPAGGQLTVLSEITPTEVTIGFADTGHGIDEAMLAKILEPLFTTKARGMGLGLSITRAIVEKNKGQLLVDSTLGKGSCFRIRLQRAEPA